MADNKKCIAISQEELDYLQKPEAERKHDLAEYYRQDPNNFSFWYPKVKDCGIRQPESEVFQLPDDVITACFEPTQEDNDRIITEYVRETVMPEIKHFCPGPYLFVKNGTFSNKFDYGNSCVIHRELHEIVSRFTYLNYMSELVGAGGMSEMIAREYIGDPNYIDENVPKIYNGMPLRPEFRVFYDFDKRKALYPAFYWDKDYCKKEIDRNFTDKIVYNECYDAIYEFYDDHKGDVVKMVSDHMAGVDLKGAWSVDIMYEEENDQYWLIDMALAAQSAYWDPEKAGII